MWASALILENGKVMPNETNQASEKFDTGERMTEIVNFQSEIRSELAQIRTLVLNERLTS